MGLCNVAVEIGTFRGDFAHAFLLRWSGLMLYCIDPWESVEGYEHQAKILVNIGGSSDRENDYVATMRKLDNWKHRSTLVRASSEDAVVSFQDNSVDFVYIDGDHRYEMVKKDLALWWPKIRQGGVIAGHDIVCNNEHKGGWGPGIQRAVHEHFQEYQEVFLVKEHNQPWSYHTTKA
jgi:predicted O-methyltransferase YrrM